MPVIISWWSLLIAVTCPLYIYESYFLTAEGEGMEAGIVNVANNMIQAVPN